MASFADYLGKMRQLWSKTNLTQRIFIGGLSVAVILSFLFMVYWLNSPDYTVLYTNLYPEDANKIVEILKSEKISYKLMDNGSTIMVPEQSVYDLRLKIAGEGAPRGPGHGLRDL